MSVKKEHICRLCLNVVENEFKKIDDNMKLIFNILLLELDLNITKDPIICQDCVDVARKCLNFKFTCIHTEVIILSYLSGRENTQYNIKVIYKEVKQVRTFADENLYVCRICMMRLEKSNFIPLDALLDDNIFEIISAYMPEMEFNSIEGPIICTRCREDLERYFNLVLYCLDIEEHIKSYRREKETYSNAQVNLANIIQFLFKDIMACPMKYPQKCIIKEKPVRFENTNDVYRNAYSRIKLEEELDIKEEEINLKENSYESLAEMRLEKCDMFYSTEHSTDTKSVMIPLKIGEHNTRECTYQKKVQGIIVEGGSVSEQNNINRHKLSQTNSLDLQSYWSACKDVSEREMYKCSLCTYESKQKYYLKTHLLVHEDVSRIKMYKCSLCPYETKWKENLTIHMLVHKDVSEIKMYKCSLCTYEAKHKHSINKHMLVHKDISELKMYKCSLCAYESKRKSNLTSHLLVHKDISEIKTYKCPLCAYETKTKGSLKMHMLIHKNISEVKMYKCSLCAYESKRKGNLTIHMLAHKDISEIEMYKCSSCTYETKNKFSFNKHVLVHKDVSEIKMYKCSLCTCETKCKRNLNRHMLVHKDVSQIKMNKCSLCTYESKQKLDLTRHMLVHKDISEIKTFKCSLCTYEAKHKCNLVKHMLVHKDVSEIKTYKCSLCTYEAKQKFSLRRHIIRHHKDISEIKT